MKDFAGGKEMPETTHQIKGYNRQNKSHFKFSCLLSSFSSSSSAFPALSQTQRPLANLQATHY
jgi:hypothetical protein